MEQSKLNNMNYKELNELVQNLQASIANQETKTQKKLFKIFEKVKKIYEEYTEKLEELRLDNSAVDDKGLIQTNEKGDYKFTKEGLKKLKEQIKELNNKEFEFKKIEVMNPQGLEDLIYLENWVTGVSFNKPEEETL